MSIVFKLSRGETWARPNWLLGVEVLLSGVGLCASKQASNDGISISFLDSELFRGAVARPRYAIPPAYLHSYEISSRRAPWPCWSKQASALPLQPCWPPVATTYTSGIRKVHARYTQCTRNVLARYTQAVRVAYGCGVYECQILR